MSFARFPLRKVLGWLAGTFFLAAVIEPLVFQTLEDHGALKRPETWMWTIAVSIVHSVGSRWFQIATGFLVGFAIGTSVDPLLRIVQITNTNNKESRIPIGSLRWIGGGMDVGRYQSTGEFQATMRIVIENPTSDLLNLEVKMSGRVNGKTSDNGTVSYKALVYAKASNILSYDSITNVPVEVDADGHSGRMFGQLDCEINYFALNEIAAPRVSRKTVEFEIPTIPPGNPGDFIQRPTVIKWRNELEA